MGKKLEQALAEADEIEDLEGSGGLTVEAQITGEGHVSRPNQARSKVLQVRLNPEEYAAVERIAAERGLPASTVARDRLLAMIAEHDAPGDLAAQATELAMLAGRLAERAMLAERESQRHERHKRHARKAPTEPV